MSLEQKKWFAAGGAVVYAGVVLFVLQFQTAYVNDPDALYHIGVSRLITERGLARTFEWAQLSIWKDRYSDKEFLLHVAMRPFVGGSPDDAIKGAKDFIGFLGLGIFAAFAFTLRRHQVPLAWLWVLILLAASAHWLVRLTMVRGHVLSILLAVLSVHFLLAANWRALAALGFAYAWGYSAPHLIVAIAAVVTACRWIYDRTWDWKPLAAAAAGVVGGSILHPYFPNNGHTLWVQNVDVLWASWTSSETVGKEMEAHASRLLLLGSPLAMAVFIASNLAAAAAPRKIGWQAFAVLALAWCFFLLYMMSWKFVEYFAPMTILAGALVCRDAFPEVRPKAWIAAAVVALAAHGLTTAVAIESQKVGQLPRWEVGASEWIRRHVPKGETILHLSFDQFPPLFLRDRDHRYLVALDPMFAYAAHPEEMEYLARVKSGREKPEPRDMANRLGGRYLVLRPVHEGVARELEAAGAKRVYRDPAASVILLTP